MFVINFLEKIIKKIAKHKREMIGDDKKKFKSCDHCRNNKIKCQSTRAQEHMCDNCMLKGIDCTFSIVGKPTRYKPTTREFNNIFTDISDLNCIIDDLQSATLLINTENTHFSTTAVIGEKNTNNHKVLKLPLSLIQDDEVLISFYYDDEFFYINNFSINVNSLNSVFNHYNTTVIVKMISLYNTWYTTTNDPLDSTDSDITDELYLDWKDLYHSDQLLLLLVLINFYIDVPLQFDFSKLIANMVQLYQLSNGETNIMSSRVFEKFIPFIIDQQHMDCSKSYNLLLVDDFFLKNFVKLLSTVLILHGPNEISSLNNKNVYLIIEELLLKKKKLDYNKHWDLKFYKVVVLNCFYHCSYNTANNQMSKKNINPCDTTGSIKRKKKPSIAQMYRDLVDYNESLMTTTSGNKDIYDILDLETKFNTVLHNLIDSSIIRNNNSNMRYTYLQIYLNQFISLNLIHFTNKTNSFTAMDYYNNNNNNNKDTDIFNGWNFQIPQHYYQSQQQYKSITEKYSSNNTMGQLLKTMSLPLCSVHYSFEIIKEQELLDIVSLELYRGSNIVKSCDLFIHDLYKLFVQCEITKNLQYSLTTTNSNINLNNSLQMKYTKTVYSNKLPQHLKKKITPLSNHATHRKPYSIKKHKKIATVNHNNYTLIPNSPNFITTQQKTSKIYQSNTNTDININFFLEDVDWLKDSTDDVLQKIHKILET